MSGDARRTLVVVSTCPGDALRAAEALGVDIVMVTDAELTWQKQYLARIVAVDALDVEASFEALTSSAAPRPDAIMTFDERAVPAAALLAERLGLVSNAYAAACAARDKFDMRRRFEAYGLDGPRFALAGTLADGEHAARATVGYPLVVKPLLGFASLGVTLASRPEDLEAAFTTAQAVARQCMRYAPDDPLAGDVLLEEYLSGPEIAIDGLLVDGRAQWIGIFDKPECLEGPTFEDTIYVTPSDQPEDVQSAALELVQQGTLALGLTTGAVHAEVRITRDGPRLVEIGARPIGGVCGRAHTYCLGVDYSALVVANALGESPPTLALGSGTPAGVAMIPALVDGRVTRIHGLDEAAAIEGVRDVLLMVREGESVRSDAPEGCYLGFILATGETTSAVRCALDAARSALAFEFSAVEQPAV